MSAPASSATTAGFYTRAEQLHFRRVTWLLQAICKKDPSYESPVATCRSMALAELSWLSNLLVRSHEVVAIMPRRGGRGVLIHSPENLIIESSPSPESSPENSLISQPCVVARNVRRDTDCNKNPFTFPGEPETQSRLNARLAPVKTVEFTRHHSVPQANEFPKHVAIVVSLLKQASNAKLKDKSIYPTASLDIHYYILRSCLNKMVARAAYHCAAFPLPGREAGSVTTVTSMANPATAKSKSKDRRCPRMQDFAKDLPPPEIWQHIILERLIEFFSINIQQHELDLFIRCAKRELQDFVKHVGHAKDDPTIWTPATGTVASCEPNVLEKQAAKYLKERFGIITGIDEAGKGFYVDISGQRSYHELLTITLASALFLLKLLHSCYATRLNDLIMNSLLECSQRLLYHLGCLAFRCPLLRFHLHRYLSNTGPKQSVKSDQAEGMPAEAPAEEEVASKENEEAICDEDAEVEEVTCEKDEGAGLEEDEEDLDTNPEVITSDQKTEDWEPRVPFATGVIRWLQLLTLHQHSIESLISTKTVMEISGLSVNILCASIPQEDIEMEDFGVCLKRFVEYERDRTDLEEMLKKENGGLKNGGSFQFNGTYHCEAMLLSLRLLVKYRRQHSCVSEELREMAESLYSKVCAVSKSCCPVCTELYAVAAEELGLSKVAVVGSHGTYFPCSLPPWLPREVAMKVTMRLEHRLKRAINEKLKQIEDKRREHGSEPMEEFDLSYSPPGWDDDV